MRSIGWSVCILFQYCVVLHFKSHDDDAITWNASDCSRNEEKRINFIVKCVRSVFIFFFPCWWIFFLQFRNGFWQEENGKISKLIILWFLIQLICWPCFFFFFFICVACTCFNHFEKTDSLPKTYTYDIYLNLINSCHQYCQFGVGKCLCFASLLFPPPFTLSPPLPLYQVIENLIHFKPNLLKIRSQNIRNFLYYVYPHGWWWLFLKTP